MKKIAVVLSGCGFLDGAEITESVATLIGLSEAGVEYKIFAPNLDYASVNHSDHQPGESRNTLVESARIARGDVNDIADLNPEEFDGVVFPGGYGAAKNLSSFASEGAQCKLLLSVESAIQQFHRDSKPIAAFCISPVLLAKALGDHQLEVTIGNDSETAAEIEKMGAQHVECAVDDFVTDRSNKVITSPAYMYEASPHLVFKGITRALKEFVEMA